MPPGRMGSRLSSEGQGNDARQQGRRLRSRPQAEENSLVDSDYRSDEDPDFEAIVEVSGEESESEEEEEEDEEDGDAEPCTSGDEEMEEAAVRRMALLVEELEDAQSDGDVDGEEDDDDDDDGEEDDEDEDSDYEEEEEEEQEMVLWYSPIGRHRRSLDTSEFRRLPKEWPPLEGDIAAEVNARTCAVNVRSLDDLDERSFASSRGPPRMKGALQMLRQREAGQAGGGGFSAAQQGHYRAFRGLPNSPAGIEDRMNSRAYIGQFSHTGEIFVAAYQHERRVRLYDVDHGFRLRKDVHARNLRWTVTDTSLSPDQRFLLYSSITPTVHLVNIPASYDEDAVFSDANVTDIHDALNFDVMEGASPHGGGRGGRGHDYPASFGIYSIQWSGDGRSIVAGTNDQSLYLYDVESRRSTQRIVGHDDDVNAVAFADDASNVMFSGSDDTFCKVWDRRDMRRSNKPAGVLPGHTEGITHIDSRGDGRHFISNGKDQTVKLWDIRTMLSAGDFNRLPAARVPSFEWDYRWMEYPGRNRDVRHPHDKAVMTYRGHSVLHTLVRAYFSPQHTTGGRFIYSGSHDGSVHIWDLVSGKRVGKLQYHREIVRDCSWHPYQDMIVSTSFDGTVCRWERGERENMPDPGYDKLDY